MKPVVRSVVFLAATAAALPIVIAAQSDRATARAETRLQLASLLFDDQRYWEAIPVFGQAKADATPEQLRQASIGLLRSLLQVAEFTQAREESEFLLAQAPRDPEVLALHGDALWSVGLFDEAEVAHRDALAIDPASGGGRNGLAKSLATRGRLDEALEWARAALATDDRVPEYHHTLGFIQSRLHDFPAAADAYERYVDLLPLAGNSEKGDWARAEVAFLRSFGDRPAMALAEPGRIHTIPFRLIRDKVIVRGRVNGRDPIDFVMDTGAERTVLSQPVAQDLGIRPIANTLSAGVGEIGMRGLQAGRLDRLQFGSLDISNLPAIIKSPPLGGLPTPEAEGFSPLSIGLSMTIDYARHVLIVGEELPDEPADITLPLWQYRLPVVRGIVNDQHHRSFVVDTGGEVISISRGTASLLPPSTLREVPLRVYGTSGWDEDAYLRPGTDLVFDQLQYRNYSVVVLNLHRPSALLGFQIGGIVGHSFLSAYRVTMDLKRGVLKLTRL